MLAHLEGERLGSHRRNGSVSNLVHRLCNGEYMIGPHHVAPETLLGIPYGLIHKFYLAHTANNLLEPRHYSENAAKSQRSKVQSLKS